MAHNALVWTYRVFDLSLSPFSRLWPPLQVVVVSCHSDHQLASRRRRCCRETLSDRWAPALQSAERRVSKKFSIQHLFSHTYTALTCVLWFFSIFPCPPSFWQEPSAQSVSEHIQGGQGSAVQARELPAESELHWQGQRPAPRQPQHGTTRPQLQFRQGTHTHAPGLLDLHTQMLNWCFTARKTKPQTSDLQFPL